MNQSTLNIQLVQHLQPGGIESLVLDLCRFSQEGQRVHIVSLEGSKESAIKLWPRLEAFENDITFLEKPLGFSLPTVFKLASFLKKNKSKGIHTHHIGPMLYGGVAAKLAGVKQWVHTEHDAWHLQNRQHRRIAQFCIKTLSPLLVADAALVAQQMEKQLPNANADVIYNGIDVTRFCPGNQMQARSIFGLPKNRQLVGCAARLHPVKGQHRLIRMLKHFPYHVQLVLAGAGEMEAELRALCSKHEVADRVYFLGNVDDMPSFYRAIDVFCLASDFEGLPLSPLEAQACNTPSVVTNVGGSRETVCPDTGYVVPLDDEPALRLAVSRAFMQSETSCPRSFVTGKYDVRKMVAEYQSLTSKRWSA